MYAFSYLKIMLYMPEIMLCFGIKIKKTHFSWQEIAKRLQNNGMSKTIDVHIEKLCIREYTFFKTSVLNMSSCLQGCDHREAYTQTQRLAITYHSWEYKVVKYHYNEACS